MNYSETKVMLAANNLERVDKRLYKSKIDDRKLAHLGADASVTDVALDDSLRTLSDALNIVHRRV